MAHLARATQEPDVVREISDAELLDLHRQGILHSYEHTDKAAAVLGGHKRTPGNWPAPDSKKAKAAKRTAHVTAPPAINEPPAAADEKGE